MGRLNYSTNQMLVMVARWGSCCRSIQRDRRGGEETDRATDRAHLDEVKDLLGEICRISGEWNVSFDVDLAGELIGSVDEGRMDKSLKVGLIGEWERVLDEQDR